MKNRKAEMGWKDDAKLAERHLDAGEYVVGTMNGTERAVFETVLAGDDPYARESVAWWEQRFGVLNASVSPEAPPAGLWSRIEAELPREAAELPGVTHAAPVAVPSNDNMLTRLRRSRGRWRVGAMAAAVAAAALGLVALNDGVREQTLPTIDRLAGWERPSTAPSGEAPAPESYVAVVNANGDQPSMIVSVTGDDITVRTLGVEKPADKSLELWYVPDGSAAVSIGLVGEGDIDLGALSAADGDLLAISVEQPGGSPTGVAQGPVIYTGKLVKAD